MEICGHALCCLIRTGMSTSRSRGSMRSGPRMAGSQRGSPSRSTGLWMMGVSPRSWYRCEGTRRLPFTTSSSKHSSSLREESWERMDGLSLSALTVQRDRGAPDHLSSLVLGTRSPRWWVPGPSMTSSRHSTWRPCPLAPPKKNPRTPNSRLRGRTSRDLWRDAALS